MKKFYDDDGLFVLDRKNMKILKAFGNLNLNSLCEKYKEKYPNADFYNGGYHYDVNNVPAVTMRGILPITFGVVSGDEFYAVSNNGCIYHSKNLYYFTLGCIGHLLEQEKPSEMLIADCIRLYTIDGSCFAKVIKNHLKTGKEWL